MDELDALVTLVAERAGFAAEAVSRQQLQRVVERCGREGLSVTAMTARLLAGDERVFEQLSSAISVAETYFFRQPEHFSHLEHERVPRWIRAGARSLKAWSAGCATGEEAWSLAACLRGAAPGLQVQVLATDLLEQNLQAARAGRYAAWSMRESGPLLHPVFEGEVASGRREVSPALRELVRFERHNLLEPAPEGGFQVVLCRNVLVYLQPAAARRVVANLGRALAPDGVLLLGPLDLMGELPGLVRDGPPELNAFRRAEPRPHSSPRVAARPAPSTPQSARVPTPEALLLRGLDQQERGLSAEAERTLEELAALAPEYLPGILERALVQVRAGNRHRAAALMREILRRTENVAPAERVPGPAELTVAYYRASAEAFLGERGDRP